MGRSALDRPRILTGTSCGVGLCSHPPGQASSGCWGQCGGEGGWWALQSHLLGSRLTSLHEASAAGPASQRGVLPGVLSGLAEEMPQRAWPSPSTPCPNATATAYLQGQAAPSHASERGWGRGQGPSRSPGPQGPCSLAPTSEPVHMLSFGPGCPTPCSQVAPAHPSQPSQLLSPGVSLWEVPAHHQPWSSPVHRGRDQAQGGGRLAHGAPVRSRASIWALSLLPTGSLGVDRECLSGRPSS